MNIDFIAILETSKLMRLYDITPINQSLPTNIYSMELNIKCSRIPNGKIDNKLDVIGYLRTQRIQTEIYTVNSSILGLGSNLNIPDGVYYIEYIINNTIKKEHKFLVYQNVKSELEKLITEAGYSIQVGNYDIEYTGDSSKYDLEKIRLAMTLYDELLINIINPDQVRVNNALDKIERLLQIIKNF